MIWGFEKSDSSGNYDGRTVAMVIILPALYFSLVFPILFAFGVDPQTIYYRYAEYGLASLVVSGALNAFYIVSLIYLCIRLIPKRIDLGVHESPVICLLVLIFVISVNYGNFALSRDEIKIDSGIASALINSVIYAYLSAVVLCTRNVHSFYLSLLALLALVVLSFERELIVYTLLPLMLRFSAGRHGIRNLLFLGLLGAVAFFSYKFFQSAMRQNMHWSIALLYDRAFWTEVLVTFLRDNLHKSSMDIAYFAGDAPAYNHLSYFAPYQVSRILQDGATTNGNLATLYYTHGQTGTGFSAILEAWLNLGPFAPVILPLAMVLGVLACVRMGSAFILIAYLVYLSKLQRAELWPTFIGYMLGPIVALVLFGLARSAYRKLSEMAAGEVGVH